MNIIYVWISYCAAILHYNIYNMKLIPIIYSKIFLKTPKINKKKKKHTCLETTMSYNTKCDNNLSFEIQ